MEALATDARILVVRSGTLRDVVMIGPAIQALRRQFPRAAITVWTSPAGEAIAHCLPHVDAVRVGADAIALSCAPTGAPSPCAVWAEQSFAAAFILTGPGETPYGWACAASLAGIPVRVGQSREFGGALLTDWVAPCCDDLYPAERYLHLLEAVGIPPAARDLQITIPPSARRHVRGLLQAAGVTGPFIAVAPGSTCSARRYSLAGYAAVLEELKDCGCTAVIVGGVQDRRLGAALARLVPGVVSLCGALTFAELAAVLDSADLFLGQDAGLLYIAHALSSRMVLLFAGTEPVPPWLARTREAVILSQPAACSPCFKAACPYDQQCLRIDPQAVAAAVRDLLPGSKDRPRRTFRRGNPVPPDRSLLSCS